MSGFAPAGNSGNRKTLDAAMNLVPFIDLLSCCISFLLITAVWSQLAAVPNTPAGAVAEPERTLTPPPPRFALYLGDDGYVVSWSTGASQAIPRRGADLDRPKLAAVLADIHTQYPDVANLEIHAQDSVAYHELVGAMDTALGAHFAAVSVDHP